MSLAIGIVVAIGASCIVVDPDYCNKDDQCPLVQTDMGMRRLLCNPIAHACTPIDDVFQCFVDSQCSEPHSPRCDTATHTCTSCRVGDSSDTSCQHFLDRPICASSSDGSGTTQCVTCVTSMDCPKESPICDTAGGQCRKCSSHADCHGSMRCDDGLPCTDSLVCIDDESVSSKLVGLAGRCAQNGPDQNGHILYVNSNDQNCKKGDGVTFSTALCDIPDWSDPALAGRPYIRITGAFQYSGSTLSNGGYAVIGAAVPSYDKLASITVHGPAFSVSGSASLTVDGINLISADLGGSTLVQCNALVGSPPTIKVRRSILTGTAVDSTNYQKAAIYIQNCNAVIDQNIIGVEDYTQLTTAAANGTAISISDGSADGAASYLIQNNIIAGNQGYALYVDSQSNTDFVFRFNTIVGNGRGIPNHMAPPIVCPQFLHLKEFSHSIVMDNATTQGMQIGNPTSCGVRDVVIGSKAQDSDPGYILLDAHLDKNFGFLAGMDNSCCIDKVTPQNGETLPAVDVDGTARPQGSAWDIGAVEKKQ